MRQNRVFSCLSAAVICLLLLIAGCVPPGEEAAKIKPEPAKEMPEAAAAEVVSLALKFTLEDSTTYKVITEAEKSVKFEGLLSKEVTSKGGCTGKRVEMTFTKQIQKLDSKGNATAKITIEELKYLSKAKDNAVLDFDSSREKDKASALAKLIGQSYTIEIAPTGEVVEIIDVKQARAAVRGRTSANRTALMLLRPDVIRKRHGISALPAADKSQLRTNDNWSSIKSHDFGLMYPKSYERIYTLKEVKDQGKRNVAIVEMNAIPTSEMAEQMYKEQATDFFSRTFDNPIDRYTGRLELDLTAGKIEKYFEKLRLEWTIVEPSAEQESDREPSVLTMAVTLLHSIEKID